MKRPRRLVSQFITAVVVGGGAAIGQRAASRVIAGVLALIAMLGGWQLNLGPAAATTSRASAEVLFVAASAAVVKRWWGAARERDLNVRSQLVFDHIMEAPPLPAAVTPKIVNLSVVCHGVSSLTATLAVTVSATVDMGVPQTASLVPPHLRPGGAASVNRIPGPQFHTMAQLRQNSTLLAARLAAANRLRPASNSSGG